MQIATAAGSGTHRYKALDSLRGICACMVVLYHFHTVGRFSNLPVIRNGYLFVDFFFVLSGFVIARSYRARIADAFPVSRFLALRMGRIYPLHLFMLGLFLASRLAALVVKGDHDALIGFYSLPALLASITLTQNFVLGSRLYWNGPSWSIAAEMWTYLLFAGVFRLLHGGRALIACCLLCAAASCAFIAATQPGYIDADRWGAFFRCTYGFALGVIGAELVPVWHRAPPGRLAAVLEIAAVVGTIALLSVIGSGPATLLAPLIFLPVILVFALERGPVSAVLRTSLPCFVGDLSYSIYMVHVFILFRVSAATGLLGRTFHVSGDVLCEGSGPCHAPGSPLLADALVLPVLLLVIAASWCTFRLVERPCQRWSRTWLLGPRRGGVQATEEQEAPAF